jgi:hypothetical protein
MPECVRKRGFPDTDGLGVAAERSGNPPTTFTRTETAMDRVRRMFQTHPAPASDAGNEAFALVRAAAECTYVCTTCADACLEESNATELRKCIRLNLDCAEICSVTAKLIARPGPQDQSLLQAQLEACAAACRACAQECEHHADAMEHCRVCAEACRECAEACERMASALVA